MLIKLREIKMKQQNLEFTKNNSIFTCIKKNIQLNTKYNRKD